MKKLFVTLISLNLVSLMACSQISTSRNGIAKKPNIIYIIADQWRADAVGYEGNPDVITPNIDKLSGESLVFKTAVSVSPVCSPHRASLLTGQYPLTHGVFQNDRPLASEAYTMGEMFKDAGYQTGYIGKWHVNGRENEDMYSSRSKPVPKNRRQGFDYWKVAEVTHNYNHSVYYDENDKKHIWPGYDAFAQTDSAISYIKRQKKDPFLLVLSWGPPHNPYYTAPKEYQDMYDPKKIQVKSNVPKELLDSAQRVYAAYYAHCTALDKSLGDIVATLEKEGIADNTILVFTSDHGDMLLSRGVYDKQRPWDESMRVPFLLRYPALFGSEKKEITKPLNTPDILPTLLGLCDIAVPPSIEGSDLSNALKGDEKYFKEAALVLLPAPFGGWKFLRGGKEYRAVRTERYTYARDLKGPWLLYDNQEDPEQLNNLINNPKYTKQQVRLEELLQEKLKETNDDFLPADKYMEKWNYQYDGNDGKRPATPFKSKYGF